jgi:hypothetical protein
MSMRRLLPLSIAAIALALACGACGDGGGSDGGQPDAIEQIDAEEAEVGHPDAPRPDFGIDGGRPDNGNPPDAGGDMNDSFAEAATLVLRDQNGARGAIDPIDDIDYYRIEFTEATWVVFDIAANPMNMSGMIDTVITLYDSQMRQVAENDDGFYIGRDSELIYHVPAAGAYYVRVQEYSTWAQLMTRNGGPTFTYQLIAFVPGGANVTVDPETGDDVASAVMFNQRSGFGVIVGTFRDAGDTDVYRIAITGADPTRMKIDVMPTGEDAFGLVSVTDVEGSTVSASATFTQGYDAIEPPAESGREYMLHVRHPGGATTANDFYVIKVIMYAEYDPETAEGMNDTLAGAEVVTFEQSAPRRAFVLARLPDGDVDHFAFELVQGETLDLTCWAGAVGSGIVELTAEVLTSTGALIQRGIEAPPSELAMEPMVDPGRVHLKLSKSSQDPTNAGDWVRCRILAE